MKIQKVFGPNDVPVEVQKALESIEDLGIGWLTKLYNKILLEGKILEAWRKSFVMSIFKGK